MSQSSLPDKITWTVPKEYRRSEHAKRVAEYSPMVWRWIGAAVVTALIGVFLACAFSRNPLCVRIGAGLVLGAVLALAHLCQHYAIADAARGGLALLTKKGPAGTIWGKVKWYQITDVAENPSLRAMEICFAWRGKDVTSLLPFDPAEVDEAQLLPFLEHYAPGKRWQH